MISEVLLSELITAVVENDANSVKKWIAQGADPNGYQDHARMRPLHHAVSTNALEAAAVLLAVGANLSECDCEGRTAYQLAQDLKKQAFCQLFDRFILKRPSNPRSQF